VEQVQDIGLHVLDHRGQRIVFGGRFEIEGAAQKVAAGVGGEKLVLARHFAAEFGDYGRFAPVGGENMLVDGIGLHLVFGRESVGGIEVFGEQIRIALDVLVGDLDRGVQVRIIEIEPVPLGDPGGIGINPGLSRVLEGEWKGVGQGPVAVSGQVDAVEAPGFGHVVAVTGDQRRGEQQDNRGNIAETCHQRASI
jgi:hypothetical protein